MKSLIVAAMLMVGFLAPASAAVLESLGLRVVLLPVQDRIGDPEVAALVSRVVREELQGHVFTPQDLMRDALRRSRIRDAGTSAPERMTDVAAELEADWFLNITILRAREQPALDAAVSGFAFRSGEATLAWAGFRSRSGLSGRRVLGIGVIEDLDRLVEQTVRDLIRDLLEPSHAWEGRKTLPHQPNAGMFRRGGLLIARRSSPVAVLPFDATVDKNPQEVADTATAAALAVLHRYGLPLVHPGWVDETLRRRFEHRYGGLDPLSRTALRLAGGADRFLTGTVDLYHTRGGMEPEPWISLGGRMVEVDSGNIFWIGGMERRGKTGEGFFGVDRIHSTGVLLDAMLDAMARNFLNNSIPAKKRNPSQ